MISKALKSRWVLLLFLLFSVHFATAQELQISGIIADQDSIPLPSVHIQIKGTNQGTITDFNGFYEIPVKPGNILVFSYVGFKTVEVAIDTARVIDIRMEADITDLSATDITVLGIRREKKTLPYQTDKVSSENLTRVVPTRTALGLTGKVAGLQINVQDQGVNPNTQIILRGLRSISQSNSPIIVIDGAVASQGAFDDLNPLDIESVNVLKGATAGILYGSLGSNGALVVTTKKGQRDQKFTIGLQSTTSFESVAYMPAFQNEYGMGFNGVDYNPIENTNWGPRFDGITRRIGPIFPDGGFQAVPYSAVENNIEDFFATGYTFQNTLYLSGGGENSTFYVSIGDQQTTGLIPSDTYDRNTFRVNASQTLGDITLSFSSSYLRDKTSVVGSRLGAYDVLIYDLLLYTPTNIPLTDYRDWQDPNSFGYADNYYNGFLENPYWAIGTSRNNDRTDRLTANIQASWDITNRVNFITRLGLDNTDGFGKDYRRRQSYDPALQPFKGYVAPFVFDSEFQTRSYSAEVLLKADFEPLEVLDLTAILGATNNFFESRISSIGFNDLNIPGFFDISNGLGTPVVSLDESKKRVYGFFADATLGYRELLFLNLAGRYDFTSTLPENENSYFYPAAGVSFILSEAIPALKESNSFIKLSASNSTTYNDLGPYQINETYSQATPFPYGNLNGFSVSDVTVDPNITKEKINTTEFGINAAFFRNRLRLDAAYFRTKSTDLITLTTPSLASGSDGFLTNIGEIETKGIELTLGGLILQSTDWEWAASLNFTSNESVVNEIAEGVNEVTISSIDKPFVGGLVGFYAIVGEAFPQIKASSYERDPEGRVVVNPENGNPELGPLKNLGKTTPDYILGFTTNIRWKTMSLSATLDYRTGHVFYDEGADRMEFSGRSIESVAYDRQDFVFPNSVIETSPGVFEENTELTTTGGGTFEYWADAYGLIKENYIRDATALKVRELALNYAFPEKYLHNSFIKTLEIGLIARNFFTYLPGENLFSDPEYQNQDEPANAIGIGGIAQPPPSRSLGLNLRIEF